MLKIYGYIIFYFVDFRQYFFEKIIFVIFFLSGNHKIKRKEAAEVF